MLRASVSPINRALTARSVRASLGAKNQDDSRDGQTSAENLEDLRNITSDSA
jgi:hypothetical protein